MARASAKRGKRPRPNARARQRAAERLAAAQPQQQPEQKKKKTGSYEDTLFFSRLRRRTKWVFVLLAVVFAIGFVAFGVGAGGTGIGDAIRDIFGAGSSGPSIEDAQKKVAENPNDPDALLELATVLQTESRNAEATDALKRYVELRPTDVSALTQLAALYDIRANEAHRRANELFQTAFGDSLRATAFNFPDTSGFLEAVGKDSIDAAVAGDAGAEAQKAQEETMRLYEQQVPVFEKLVALQPNEPTVWIQLGTSATAAGQNDKAIDAFQTFVDRFPDHPSVPSVEDELKTLRANADVAIG